MNATDDTGFGVEHLPYGVVSRFGAEPRPVVRIGDQALELAPLAAAGLLDEVAVEHQALSRALDASTLNPLLELGPTAWSSLRARLADLLGDTNAGLAGTELADRALVSLDEVETALPIEVADYVDFYSSLEHASNVGRHAPPRRRPAVAQLAPPAGRLPRPRRLGGRRAARRSAGRRDRARPPSRADSPVFGPERLLDFELELGFVTGPGLALGEPVTPTERAGHVFGFALVNDWSARSMQAWEYKPLGPCLSKSFATSLATWITPAGGAGPVSGRGPTLSPSPPPTCAEPPSPARSTWTWRSRWSPPDRTRSR